MSSWIIVPDFAFRLLELSGPQMSSTSPQHRLRPLPHVQIDALSGVFQGIGHR